MGSAIWQLVLLLVLIVVNGVFSMSETAIISSKRARLQQRAEAGDERARVALDLIAQPDRFLSTVQIGITLIGILSGALGESSVGVLFSLGLQRLGLAPPMAQSVGFTLGIVAITYLSLVLGELLPKTLALGNPENIATRVASPMRLLSKIAKPLVSFLTLSTNGLQKLLGVKASTEPPVTQDEVKILIEQGTRAGVFDEGEREIVERLFRAADRKITSVMTPRREIAFLDTDDPWEESARKIAAVPHTAFPVCAGGLDNLLGIVTLKSLWLQNLDIAPQTAPKLSELLQEPLFLREQLLALEALEEFRRTARTLALVIDEYGNVVGLITLHDLLEALVGELGTDGVGGEDASAIRRDDGSWLLDGMLPVDEFLHVLGIRISPDDVGEYATLGGFVMARTATMPRAGDHFVWAEHRFEVLDMDGHRVDKVLVSQNSNAPT